MLNEDDEYEKYLETQMEQEANGYINNLELNDNMSDDELIKRPKEEIIQYKNIIINKLKAYTASLEKEKDDLIREFKITTDALIEKIKDIEFSNKGIRPQTAMIVKGMRGNSNNSKQPSNEPQIAMQRCPNCTKEFPITNFIEHSLQCLRKIYKCTKCNIMIPVEEKETHFLMYSNKQKMIKAIKGNDLQFFSSAINHEFPVNNVIDAETGDYILHLLVKNERIQMVRFLSKNYQGDINANVRNIADMTALMLSAKKGDCEIAEELIKLGANVNEKNILGETAVKIAQSSKNEKFAMMLIEKYKANISFK